MRQNLMNREGWQGFRIGKDRDHRRKLTEENKIEIRKKYKAGGISQRGMAKEYGVSRRLIVFTLHPERLLELYRRRKEEKAWLKYYDKETHKYYMRNYRNHVREIVTGK